MTVVLRLHMNRGWNNDLFDCNTPIDENATMTYWMLSRNFFTQKIFDGATTRRALQIFNEDHAVLNHLNPVELPPGLRDEFSVESDALMVAFRKKRQELYARGWGVDLQTYEHEYGERKAAVIPSPARRGDPKAGCCRKCHGCQKPASRSGGRRNKFYPGFLNFTRNRQV